MSTKIPDGFHKHKNGGGLVANTAYVDDSVFINGNARVSGNAWVSGDARVSGNAQVFGDAWACSPLYIQGTKHALTNSRHGYISIGCHENTFEYWQAHYKAIGRAEGYTAEETEQYGLFIQIFVKIGK